MSIQCNLRKIRTDVCYTQAELAELCDLAEQTIRNIETGTEPKLLTAYKIAKVLDRSIYDIWPAVVV